MKWRERRRLWKLGQRGERIADPEDAKRVRDYMEYWEWFRWVVLVPRVQSCVMDASGGNVIQLTTNGADDTGPIWSPDGKQVAFTSNRDGNLEVYVMHNDGSQQTRLTFDSAVDAATGWQPLVATAITLQPDSGPPGTVVQVSGSGYGSFERVRLGFLDSGHMTGLGTVATDSAGHFDLQVMIPTRATIGPHRVVA